MEAIKFLILVTLMTILVSCSTVPTKNTISTWQPEINQPIQQLEEQLAKLEQQQPMNYTISNLAFLYDAKLYIQFNKLLDKVSDSKRKHLIKEQEEWLIKRKESVNKAYDKNKNKTANQTVVVATPYGKIRPNRAGTIAPYLSAQTFIDTTKKRIQVINTQLVKQ